nr:cytoplasmic trna 2-thiolation protein 1 [Quercus suber]
MAPSVCQVCNTARAQILRPKNQTRLCAPCFTSTFESEISSTISSAGLFQHGERVAIGASGGKDSTVLASVLKTLNDRHGWGLDLVLLSIDEGITGYRDHSLEAVKRHAAQYALPLKIVSYTDLYGWSMDEVVQQVGKKGNCTYCGVFRRQALDRGAAMLGVAHVVTGHNADDVAETVLMNLLRGDLPRLSRATSIVTSTPGLRRGTSEGEEVAFTNVKRSKPLMYAYEKEIVLYAHHKKLDYFSTECIYSPEAFRGSARTLIKNLERIRPESILDVVRSGVDMARLVPDAEGNAKGACKPTTAGLDEEEAPNGCGSGAAQDGGGEMAEMEQKLQANDRAEAEGLETEIKAPFSRHSDGPIRHKNPKAQELEQQINETQTHPPAIVPIRTKKEKKTNPKRSRDAPTPKQTLGQCERCGYLSSQTVCKACMLLEGLRARDRSSPMSTAPRLGHVDTSVRFLLLRSLLIVIKAIHRPIESQLQSMHKSNSPRTTFSIKSLCRQQCLSFQLLTSSFRSCEDENDLVASCAPVDCAVPDTAFSIPNHQRILATGHISEIAYPVRLELIWPSPGDHTVDLQYSRVDGAVDLALSSRTLPNGSRGLFSSNMGLGTMSHAVHLQFLLSASYTQRQPREGCPHSFFHSFPPPLPPPLIAKRILGLGRASIQYPQSYFLLRIVARFPHPMLY